MHKYLVPITPERSIRDFLSTLFWTAWQSAVHEDATVNPDKVFQPDVWRVVDISGVAFSGKILCGRRIYIDGHFTNDGLIALPAVSLDPRRQTWLKAFPTYIDLFEETLLRLKIPYKGNRIYA